MRNIDEQLRIVLQGAQRKKEQAARRRSRIRSAGISACAFLLVVAAAASAGSVDFAEQIQQDGTVYGSFLLYRPYLGYLAVGTLAFLIGISVTLLCVTIHRGEGRKK